MLYCVEPGLGAVTPLSSRELWDFIDFGWAKEREAIGKGVGIYGVNFTHHPSFHKSQVPGSQGLGWVTGTQRCIRQSRHSYEVEGRREGHSKHVREVMRLSSS